MNESAKHDLDLLVSRRWDPRTGMGKSLGRLEWGIGLALALFIILSLTGMLIPTAVSNAAGVLVYVPVLALVICWLIPRDIKAKTAKKLEQHDFFLCVWCRYPLTGLPDEGECPECGAGYERENCRTLYQQAYAKFKPDPQTFSKREYTAWRKALGLRDHSDSKTSDYIAEVTDP